MIKRICATLAISVIYLFFSVQGIPQAAPVDASLTRAGVHPADKAISREDIATAKTLEQSKGSARDASVTAPSIVARYSEGDRSWTFFAKVIQLKDVSIYGRPGAIAQVEYVRAGEPQYAWTVIKIDDYYFGDNDGAIIEGQEITLEVSGEYVSSQGVNWDACPPNDKYCQYASFIEGGFPVSEDYYGLTICPSNALIYSGYASDDWINGMLAWKIKIVN